MKKQLFCKITALLLALITALTAAACVKGDAGDDTAADTTAADTTVTDTAAADTTDAATVAPGTTEPETTVPDTTEEATTEEPATAEPGTTEPETTAPETTEPETTAPETTVPETTKPEITAPVTTAPETTAPVTTANDDPTPQPTVYKTDNGVSYTASGEVSGSNGTFMVKKDFVISFEAGQLNKTFNRFTLKYTSSKPLRIYVTYKKSSGSGSDDFYLEAGNNASFSGLLSSYLQSGTSSELNGIKVETLDGKTSTFTLHSVSCEKVEVYNSKQYYIENSRFKVGIQLSWGGGINCVQDKTCTISGLTNLINSHDTGRLVQQSYYGTAGNSEYKPGRFNGSVWTYNPVQGGDQYGNASRLIDVFVTENSVYIKSQPQDWSLNNQITRSYMENKYTLTDSYVKVDNRFVDFSGWEHRYTNQELPAFYTVSYLDRFTWYGGSEGWTNGGLSVRDDLQFWGDARYAESCRFPVKSSNTETWCAWVSSKNDFGIGLYVPNIDLLYAGRFNYNGSKLSSNDATNYVAPLMTIKMVSYVPIEYSYLITTGSTEQIRQTFYENRNFADNASLHKNYTSMRVPDGDLDFTNIDFSLKGYAAVANSPNNTEISYSDTQKALQLKVTRPDDPQVMIDYTSSDVPLTADDYKTLKIEYMIPNDCSQSSYVCDLFLCTGTKMNPDGSERTRITLTKDGEYHTAVVNLSSLPFWTGKINRIRFDYFDACAVGDVIYVKSFVLE